MLILWCTFFPSRRASSTIWSVCGSPRQRMTPEELKSRRTKKAMPAAPRQSALSSVEPLPLSLSDGSGARNAVYPVAIKLTVAWIGKTKEPAIQSLTKEYLRRLEHYAEAEGIALKDEAALLQRWLEFPFSHEARIGLAGRQGQADVFGRVGAVSGRPSGAQSRTTVVCRRTSRWIQRSGAATAARLLSLAK